MSSSASTAENVAAPPRLARPDPVVRYLPLLLVGYVAVIFGASALLELHGVMVEGQTLAYDRALFLSISTATLTGFQLGIGASEFNPDGPLGPAVLLGLTVVGTFFVLAVGGLAAARVLRLRHTDSQILTAALTLQAFATLTGALVLFLCGRPISDAFSQAACALGNSGAILTGKGHQLPTLGSLLTQTVLLPLAVVGSLGLPVIMDLWDRATGTARELSPYTWTVLKLSCGFYIAATTVLFIASLNQDYSPGTPNPGPAGAFLAASTTAIFSRTCGMPLGLLGYFPRPTLWLILVLMIAGGASAGTAGGVKINTIGKIFSGLGDALAGRRAGRLFAIAVIALIGYTFFFGLGTVALSITDSQQQDRIPFLVVSALSNVGLSLDPLSIVGNGLCVLDMLMMIGRLAPLGLLWWTARTTFDGDGVVG